jgi:hypothetical protein
MNINDIFTSKYLRAADVQGQHQLTIARTAMEQLGDETKLVLYFKGSDKGMVMNKTNSNNVAKVYGPETNGWIGKPIVIATAMTDYQGQSVACLRLYPPQQTQHAPQPVQQAPLPGQLSTGQGQQVAPDPFHAEVDDEIPF